MKNRANIRAISRTKRVKPIKPPFPLKFLLAKQTFQLCRISAFSPQVNKRDKFYCNFKYSEAEPKINELMPQRELVARVHTSREYLFHIVKVETDLQVVAGWLSP